MCFPQNWKDVLPAVTHVRYPIDDSCRTSLTHLRCRMPENSFDVHHLRTFKISLVAWLLRVQGYSPHASELINQLVFALNQTFREVELSYLVWRNERVQTILKHGIHPSFPLLRGRRY